MAAGLQTSAKYVFIGGPREGRTFSSLAGYSGNNPGYYWTGLAIPNDVGQDGTRAVLNDTTDADYVGMASEVTGLDGPEIRESSIDNVEQDGAQHGEFYTGRRPVTVTAQIGANLSVTNRNLAQGRWLAATGRALRTFGPNNRPGVLIWTPLGYPQMYLRYRSQQPTRISGQFLKDGGAALIASDPRIYSTTIHTGATVTPSGSGTAGRSYDRGYIANYDWAPSVGAQSLTNLGDGDAPVIITLHGALSTFAIQNVTTGEELSLNGGIATTDTLVIDTLAKSIILNGTTNAYGMLEVQRSRWWGLAPGVNSIQLLATSFSGSPSMIITYQDAWI